MARLLFLLALTLAAAACATHKDMSRQESLDIMRVMNAIGE